MGVFIMNNVPISFSEQMYLNFQSMTPSEVKGQCNTTVEQYKRQLYNYVYSVFNFTLPSHWALNWFRYWLFRAGSIGVVYTHKYGWIDQPYGVEGITIDYQPRKIIVYNSFLPKPAGGIIGENAGIVHILDDYLGFDDVVTRHAEMLAQCDKSININLMNCNLALIFEAETKKEGEAIKEAYEQATTGKPLVVLNKDIMNGKKLTTMFPNVNQNFIANDICDLKRTIINSFLTYCGISNSPIDKKERSIVDEVNSNNQETEAIVSVIEKNIKKDFDMINKISGLRLNVSRETSKEGGGYEGNA